MADNRKLLVAVDDSETSAYAFTWTLYNLIKQDDHLVVLHVAQGPPLLPNPDLVGDYVVPPLEPSGIDLEATVTQESTALVNKYLQQCAQNNISCEGKVVKGDPGSWIVEEADKISADMVVVGSHAYGLLKRALFGSSSDYVLHNTICPVAIIRQPELPRMHDPLTSAGVSRKIVIAIDRSAQAFHAFKWALHNFCRESDKVIVYHVHHPTTLPVTAVGTGEFGMEEVYVPADLTEKDDVQALNDSEHLVEKYMQYATKETKIPCEGMVVTGPTEQRVCEGLQALQADAVVIGSYGRGMLARTFLGSVSDFLSHHSPCPVIVVKTQKQKEEDVEKQKQENIGDLHQHAI